MDTLSTMAILRLALYALIGDINRAHVIRLSTLDCEGLFSIHLECVD
jgi:hypothetical protein